MLSTTPTGVERLRVLKEQLRLFSVTGSALPSPDALAALQQELPVRDRLAALLEGELDFHGEDSGYASHDLHAFAAKFPPQLPRAFIRGLTRPGDMVLDPMMGSGTAVVEALLEGRRGLGLDIDPLALRLGHVKTMALDIGRLREIAYNVLSQANALLADQGALETTVTRRFDERTKSFLDYWFLPSTQRELMALVLAIEDVRDGPSRRFLELTCSSIIITKSGGVSRARDLAHSRPHLVETKIPKHALEQFSTRLRKNLTSLAQLVPAATRALILAGDARSMPFAGSSIDLIVTSPPYANAIDYMRAHKFSLIWFGQDLATLSELRGSYIGSERVARSLYGALPDHPASTVRELEKLDSSKAAVLRKYFIEMQAVLREMFRVLRPQSAAVLVVGTSIMRGIDVRTHDALVDIARDLGFDVVGIARRVLDRNKRMMPARFGQRADSMIEQRMHDEYVIGLLKPGRMNGRPHGE